MKYAKLQGTKEKHFTVVVLSEKEVELLLTTLSAAPERATREQKILNGIIAGLHQSAPKVDSGWLRGL